MNQEKGQSNWIASELYVGEGLNLSNRPNPFPGSKVGSPETRLVSRGQSQTSPKAEEGLVQLT